MHSRCEIFKVQANGNCDWVWEVSVIYRGSRKTFLQRMTENLVWKLEGLQWKTPRRADEEHPSQQSRALKKQRTSWDKMSTCSRKSHQASTNADSGRKQSTYHLHSAAWVTLGCLGFSLLALPVHPSVHIVLYPSSQSPKQCLSLSGLKFLIWLNY